jgi:hypothetical protein
MRTIRPVAAACVAACALAFTALPARANLLIEVDKSTQTMTVSEDGARLYTWPVSTGIARYDTPSGRFTPFRMDKDHFSREWDDAPMPNSIFFTQRGHAIHGTNHSSIGRPASHGCVRLSVEHSQILFDLVKREGMPNTKVVLFGEIPPPASPPAVARRGQPDQPQQRVEQRYPGQYQYYERRDYSDRRYGSDNDDEMTTGSVPRRDPNSYWRNERPTYWGGRSPTYDDRAARDYPPPPPPPPFFFPGQRYYGQD